MIDQMERGGTGPRPRPVALRMPPQAEPIDRSGFAGALGDTPGVAADGLFDVFKDIVGGIKDVLPIATTVAPMLGLP